MSWWPLHSPKFHKMYSVRKKTREFYVIENIFSVNLTEVHKDSNNFLSAFT